MIHPFPCHSIFSQQTSRKDIVVAQMPHSFADPINKLLNCFTVSHQLGMLKSFFLKNRLSFAKNPFFLDYRFWRHSNRWLLEHAGLPWGLMQLSRWVVERQAYKQTGHADWTDRLPHVLAMSVTCHGNIQSAAESGGGRETAACSKQHRLKRYLLDGSGGEGRTRVLSANYLQSHRPPSRPTEQASRWPGYPSQRRGPTVKCQLRWGVSP